MGTSLHDNKLPMILPKFDVLPHFSLRLFQIWHLKFLMGTSAYDGELPMQLHVLVYEPYSSTFLYLAFL